MRSTDTNIIMITAGGIGQRFGGDIPKQYMKLLGRPVISYVIEECQKCKNADAILVVADPVYHEELSFFYGVDTTSSGDSLNITKRKGLDYIREHSSCEKVVIVDAVRPTIEHETIDKQFALLNKYDAVACAREITDSLGHHGDWYINRNEYYTLNAPEGFRFDVIDMYFNSKSIYTESIHQLPEFSKVYLDFDVPYYEKITYPEDLIKLEALISSKLELKNHPVSTFDINNDIYFEKKCLYSKGLRDFLFLRERKKTILWINSIYADLKSLFQRWAISSFSVNQNARYGLVILAHSTHYGEVVIKCIPDFVNRYEREKEAISVLPPSYICPMIDYDDNSKTILLRQISPAEYASLDEYQKLMSFFKVVRDDAVLYNENSSLVHIPFYIDELKEKYMNIKAVPYLSEQIFDELSKAIEIWDKYLASEQLYIIHGDLHNQNVLDDGTQFWGVDPCGFIAPLVFEYVRFIRNDIRNHPAFGYENRLDLLIHCFHQLIDSTKLLAAFIVDMAFCTYNSTFENFEMQETLLNLKLLEIAHKKLQ